MIDLVTAAVLNLPLLVLPDVNVTPNGNGLPGISQLRTIMSAVMTIRLVSRGQ